MECRIEVGWFNGLMVSKLHGFKVTWLHGYMVLIQVKVAPWATFTCSGLRDTLATSR